MCSELAPRAHIPDTRIPQLMQPWRINSQSQCSIVKSCILTTNCISNTYHLLSLAPHFCLTESPPIKDNSGKVRGSISTATSHIMLPSSKNQRSVWVSKWVTPKKEWLGQRHGHKFSLRHNSTRFREAIGPWFRGETPTYVRCPHDLRSQELFLTTILLPQQKYYWFLVVLIGDDLKYAWSKQLV